MADARRFTSASGGGRTARVYVGDGNKSRCRWRRRRELRCAFRGGIAVALQPVGRRSDARSRRSRSAAAARSSCNQDPAKAVKDADVVYTDTWVSMGRKPRPRARCSAARYQVNDELMKHVGKQTIVMHCLPAHRATKSPTAWPRRAVMRFSSRAEKPASHSKGDPRHGDELANIGRHTGMSQRL